jgi:hypothetical protein
MASLRILRFLSSNSRKVMWSETWPGMAKTVLELPLASWARVELTSVVRAAWLTSYCWSASSGLSGRPDQTTDSGSTGGMKRVDSPEAMS